MQYIVCALYAYHHCRIKGYASKGSSIHANRGGGTSCVLPFSGFLWIFNVRLPTNDTASYHPTEVGGEELTTGLRIAVFYLYL